MIRVLINGHDLYEEFGMLMTNRNISNLEAIRHTIEIPGMNGVLDYSDFFGKKVYRNRPINVEVSCKNKELSVTLKDYFERLVDNKEIFIIFSDDINHYWKGYCNLSNNNDGYILKYNLKIDAYPFKYNVSDDKEVNCYV